MSNRMNRESTERSISDMWQAMADAAVTREHLPALIAKAEKGGEA